MNTKTKKSKILLQTTLGIAECCSLFLGPSWSLISFFLVCRGHLVTVLLINRIQFGIIRTTRCFSGKQ